MNVYVVKCLVSYEDDEKDSAEYIFGVFSSTEQAMLAITTADKNVTFSSNDVNYIEGISETEDMCAEYWTQSFNLDK